MPRWRYVRLPSAVFSSMSWTNNSVSTPVVETLSVALIGPTIAMGLVTAGVAYSNSSGPSAVVNGGPKVGPAWYDHDWRREPDTYVSEGTSSAPGFVLDNWPPARR